MLESIIKKGIESKNFFVLFYVSFIMKSIDKGNKPNTKGYTITYKYYQYDCYFRYQKQAKIRTKTMSCRLFEEKEHTRKYHLHRPGYTKQLFDYILNYYFDENPTDKKIPFALDVGCGSGQATVELSS